MSSVVLKLWENERSVLGHCLRYNLYLEDIHHDHTHAFLPPKVFNCARQSQVFSRQISKFLKQKLAILDIPVGLFGNPFYRLVLLPPKELECLIFYAGSILQAEKLKRVVDKTTRKQLIALLGEETYAFAMKRSALYRPWIAQLSLPQGYCEETLLELVKKSGQYCLECCFTASPGELLKRLTLKFSLDYRWCFSHAIDFDTKMQVFNFLKQLLKREMQSQFVTCL